MQYLYQQQNKNNKRKMYQILGEHQNSKLVASAMGWEKNVRQCNGIIPHETGSTLNFSRVWLESWR